jgi:hypothetical protein
VILEKNLIPWTVGLAVALLLSVVLNLIQLVGSMVDARTDSIECDKRIDAALAVKAAAEAQAATQAQDTVDEMAIKDTTVERDRLAAITRERDRTLAELRRLQRAATTSTDGPGCRVPADRVRVLNRALSGGAPAHLVQPSVPNPL